MYHSIDKAIEAINQNYATLSPECCTDFSQHSKWVHCKRNTVLVREGQFSDKTYFIVSGAARAYYLKDGKEINDWFAFENDFICSINSYFLDIPSPHFIAFSEPTDLIEISKTAMLELCEKHRDFERLCLVIVTRTMLRLQKRVVALQFETAVQRYENLLATQPHINKRVGLGHIASYLGISVETLSRIRKPRKRI